MRLKKEMVLEIIALRYIQWASIEHRFDRSIISMRLKRDEGGDVIFFFLECGDLGYDSDEHDCLYD